MDDINEHYCTVSDGAKLHYLQAGTGSPLIMLPGGGLSANIFQDQLIEFSKHYNVISLDKRGHGKSEKVDFGYRVSRFAKDIYDLLEQLKLERVNLLCHSLGASIVYHYIDMFGTEAINSLTIVDEPPALLINPDWSEQEIKDYGALYQAATLHELTNTFIKDKSPDFKMQLIDAMTTQYATLQHKQFIFDCLDIPGEAAAKLYFNNICQDYRDVISKIDIPTLYITGRASLIPWQSHVWMQQLTPNSKLAIFEEKEGGNHFIFVENPDKFNKVVLDFLAETPNSNHA